MRALGFRLVEEKEIVEEDDSGKRRVKTERTVKEIAPDLEALKLLTAMEERDGPGITIVSCVPRPERDAVETEVQA